MTPLNVVELTDQQKRKWIETRSALLWKAPAFTYILFTMLNPRNGELVAVFTDDPSIPVAATDGASLIINPEVFFKLPLDERIFIAAHEILHCIWDHVGITAPMEVAGAVKYTDGTSLPYEHDTMNQAMDFVINDLLVNDKIGTFPSIGGCHDPKLVTMNDNFMDAYRKVYQKKQQNPQQVPPSFDVLMQPGAGGGSPQQGQPPGRNKAAWDTAIAAAIASAKAQGKLSGNLERLFEEILEPKVDWQDYIRGFMARRVGGGGYDWRKPDRNLIIRNIYAPRRSGYGCGTIVVAVDTSGSITNKELSVFSGEMCGILDDVRPERLIVLWCDAKVHKVDFVEDSYEIGSLKPVGGGGTDFRPAFDWIEDNHISPDALVYLTDGYGSFPQHAPSYPVLWGSISDASYPWGDAIKVEL